MGNKLEPYW